MAEGKLNRWTAWAARSSDVWSNRRSFRLSRSRAAFGFSAAQVIARAKRSASRRSGLARRRSSSCFSRSQAAGSAATLSPGATTAYVIRLRRQRDRRNSQHRMRAWLLDDDIEALHEHARLGAQPLALEAAPERLGFIDGRLRPQAVQGGLLGGAVARRLLRFGRRLRRGRRIRKWGRAGAGIAKPRLSIRRESCGRNFSQLSSLAKREASSLVGLARRRTRRSASRSQSASGERGGATSVLAVTSGAASLGYADSERRKSLTFRGRPDQSDRHFAEGPPYPAIAARGRVARSARSSGLF
jgi:hypothetical protein